MMILGALALAWADGVRGKRTIDEVGLRDALLMGGAQAIALQPGVSRSGVTITVGRFSGLGRDGAARFAFLMSLPITFGAIVFKWFDVSGRGRHPGGLPRAVHLGDRRLGHHRLHRRVGHAEAHPHPLVLAVRRSTASILWASLILLIRWPAPSADQAAARRPGRARPTRW